MAASGALTATTLTALASALQTYGQQRGAELEVRLRGLTRDMFTQVLEGLASQGLKFEELRTVNAIADYASGQAGVSHIHTIELDPEGGRVRTTNTVKSLLTQVRLDAAAFQGLDCAVSVSTETPVESAPVTGEKGVYRVKFRRSAPLGGALAGWRADLTVVRQVSGPGDQFPAVVRQLLVEKAFEGPGIRWEVEAEWTLPEPPPREGVLAAAQALASLAVAGGTPKARLAHEVRTVARFVAKGRDVARRDTLKEVLPQVHNLTRSLYRDIFPPLGYFVTEKADGARAVARAGPEGGALVTALGLTEFPPREGTPLTVLDGELVEGKFYAFDVIVAGGKPAVDLPFEERAALLPAAARAAAGAGLPVAAKKYVKLSSLETLEGEFREVLEGKFPYEIDGLILVRPGEGYMGTRSWKWKLPEFNSIDFLARRVKDEYLLFVGTSADALLSQQLEKCPEYEELFGGLGGRLYVPIQFSPPNAPRAYRVPAAALPAGEWDGRVLEMVPLRASPPEWRFLRERKDRAEDLQAGTYFGNDRRVAMDAWLNFVDPFPPQQLWEGLGKGDYFLQGHNADYDAQIRAVSDLKAVTIRQYLTGAARVLDIACGRGQDLGRYGTARVGALVGVDRDASALAELMRRLNESSGRRGSVPRTTVLQMDMADPTLGPAAVAAAGGERFAGVVCNLALHYVLQTSEQMDQVAATVAGALEPGGVFLCTVMVGEDVFGVLRGTPPGRSWDLCGAPGEKFPPGSPKFSIRRDFESDELTDAGQKIGVLLPFSQGVYYEEYLVNSAALERSMRRHGLDLVETRRPQVEGLSPMDAQYVRLFGTHVFRKD